MNEGFYNRRELNVVIYESLKDDAFVMITNDRYPNRPVVLVGDEAIELVRTIVDKITVATDEQEEA